MGLFPCHFPCQFIKKDQESDNNSHMERSSNSSSSLSSQPSLPSVPSLTPPHAEQPSTAYHHFISTLKGHTSYVFSINLGGKYIYTGSSNGEIRRWIRYPSIQEDHALNNIIVAQSHSAVKSIVVLGDKLFTSHQDHKIRVWKIDNNCNNNYYKCIATLPTLNDRCMKVLRAKNYVQVRRHKKCTFVHHVDTVSTLTLSKDGSLIYSASWDRTFKVWRTSDYKCLESIWNAHDDAINTIVISRDGYVYTGSADKKIKVWKKQEGYKSQHSLVNTLEKHKSAVNALTLSSDGSVLYSGACDRSIIVWEKDGHNMVVSGALRRHSKAILCLTVVSSLVLSGSADKTVRVWRRGIGMNYSCLAVFEGHNGPVKCLTAALTDDSRDNSTGNSYLVYSGGLDCDVKIWKIWVPFL